MIVDFACSDCADTFERPQVECEACNHYAYVKDLLCGFDDGPQLGSERV